MRAHQIGSAFRPQSRRPSAVDTYGRGDSLLNQVQELKSKSQLSSQEFLLLMRPLLTAAPRAKLKVLDARRFDLQSWIIFAFSLTLTVLKFLPETPSGM